MILTRRLHNIHPGTELGSRPQTRLSSTCMRQIWGPEQVGMEAKPTHATGKQSAKCRSGLT